MVLCKCGCVHTVHSDGVQTIQGIALILGSLIAWGLGHISDGALYVYQYIFLGECVGCGDWYLGKEADSVQSTDRSD